MFEWRADFELGIQLIDDQHKKLLAVGNRISHLLADHDDDSDDYDKIIGVIDELKEYTVYHFNTEEELFKRYNYPDYEAHKKEHDNFIAYIDTFDFSTIDDDQKKVIRDLLKKVINWVFNHIITTDFLYKEFFIKHEVK